MQQGEQSAYIAVGRKGLMALVDAADVPLLSGYRWRALLCGSGKRYAIAFVGGHRFLMHRLLLGLPERGGPEGDHINGDTLDNRRCNLRPATHAQNMQNRPSHRGSTAPYRGVYRAGSRWRTQVTIGGKKITLGTFATPEEAAERVSAYRARHMPFSLDALQSVAA